jgi:hypothetical protein
LREKILRRRQRQIYTVDRGDKEREKNRDRETETGERRETDRKRHLEWRGFT